MKLGDLKVIDDCNQNQEIERNSIIKGNCLEVMKGIKDKSVDMILCDLPYGTTACKWDEIIPFEPLWEQYKRVIKDNGAIVLFGKEPFSSKMRISNISMFKYDWYWIKDTKSNFLQANYQPLNNIEIISVFSKAYARGFSNNKYNVMKYNPIMKEGKKYNIPKESKTTQIFQTNHKNGIFKHKEKDTSKRFPYNLLEFITDKNRLHPTQKPTALLEYLIKTYTLEGELILDNTAGSMSTAVASINTNRDFIMIEMDDKYFEVGKERIKNHLSNQEQI